MALSTLLGLRCSEDRMEAVVHVFLLINPVKSLQRSWVGDKQAQKLAGAVLVSC